MRVTLSVVSLSLCLVACDFPKSVGETEESGSTTSGGSDTDSSTGSVSTSTTSGGNPTATASASGSATSAGSATSGGSCPPFDPGPSEGEGLYFWECGCLACELEFNDIPLETVMQFENIDLCSCLCEEAGCGPFQGAGGVASGPDGDTESGDFPDTDGGGGLPDSDSTGVATTGAAWISHDDCIAEGGTVIGDPGDGSVFEPDYMCPDGGVLLGVLDFMPGMPFPENGGVCCV